MVLTKTPLLGYGCYGASLFDPIKNPWEGKMRIIIEIPDFLLPLFVKELKTQFPVIIVRNALRKHSERLANETRPQCFASALSNARIRVEK